MRLTGLAATDPTDASGTLLFDLARDVWADGVIAALGLPAGKLPPVLRTTEVAGQLLPRPANELGLTPGIPVAVGAADTAAALYAADLGAGWALLTVGTGGQWMVPEGEFRPVRNTNLFRSVDAGAAGESAAVGGGFYRLAPVQNAGVALDWVRGVLGVSWQQLYDTAAAAVAGGHAGVPAVPGARAVGSGDGRRLGGTHARPRQGRPRARRD